MNKVLSIGLILCLLFHLGGYYLLFVGLSYSAYHSLSRKIDREQYSDVQFREFKVPITLPYPIHNNGAVRTYGEIEVDGEFYVLAQQEIVHDTLYILGVKKEDQTRINHAFDRYLGLSEQSPPGNEQTLSLLSKLIKEYKSQAKPALVSVGGWDLELGETPFQLPALQHHSQRIYHPPLG
ncbi:MAG: hypothetical protein HC859_02450 [Bacteroidia bacterium]|nr:hypothetical protein [Bacteroidia bacterium]